MKSLAIVLGLFLLISCKDTPVTLKNTNTQSDIPKYTVAQVDSIKPKRRMDRYYKRVVTQKGDTLLPFILQDSVPVFFSRYGKENPENQVRITTRYGNIEMELFEDRPLYRSSFIFLVKEGYFNETVFHRTVKGFIAQAGNSDRKMTAMLRNSAGNYQLPPDIKLNDKHAYGTVSSSKYWEDNPENWHNPFDFFISLKPAAHLDGEHTIFGRVTKGMEVVEQIAAQPTDSRDWPLDDIHIEAQVIK